MDLPVLLAAESAPLSLSLRIPLSALNFLEYGIWGAWWVVLGQYLDGLNFSRKQIGRVYATMALGAIFSPMFAGWLADSFKASEYVLAGSHLIGAVLLFALAFIHNEKLFYWVTLAYALVYSPTMGLANAVVFEHAGGSSEFPLIRVLGTIGWIVTGLSLKLLLKPNQPVNNRPILLASALSVVLGVFCFWLPHTEPSAAAAIEPAAQQNAGFLSNLPFVQALALFRDPSFGAFFTATFVVAAAFAFYFAFTALYLEKRLHVRPDNAGPLMTLGQWVEIGGMFALAWAVPRFGYKPVLAVGMIAVAVRYGIFSLGQPFSLVVLAIALHGICFDFFLAAGMMYVNDAAPQAIRASAQSLFVVLAYGFGMYFGTEGAGWLNQRLTRDGTGADGKPERVTNWKTFWLVPSVATAVAVVLFLALFRNPTPAGAAASGKTPAAVTVETAEEAAEALPGEK